MGWDVAAAEDPGANGRLAVQLVVTLLRYLQITGDPYSLQYLGVNLVIGMLWWEVVRHFRLELVGATR